MSIDRYRNEYLPGLRPFLRKHGAEVLVAGFDAEPAEGEPPNSTVVLRFADAAAAWGLLNDPDYRPALVQGRKNRPRSRWSRRRRHCNAGDRAAENGGNPRYQRI